MLKELAEAVEKGKTVVLGQDDKTGQINLLGAYDDTTEASWTFQETPGVVLLKGEVLKRSWVP